MARTPLYSASPRAPRGPGRAAAAAAGPAAPVSSTTGAAPNPSASFPPTRWQRGRAWLLRHERQAWALGAVALAVGAGWPAWTLRLTPPPTLKQIDAALRESIAKEPLPSAAAAAYRAVLPSLVRVVGERDEDDEPGARKRAKVARAAPGASAPAGDDEDAERRRSVGTGVVIVDRGIILTNLHVVQGASRLKVTFSDGLESDAVVINTQPEHDLAVLQAKTLPDDLQAATMRSTSGLEPGDEVIAVGFPFGIGPSVSQGVVSGLKREFRSPEGQRSLTNLIQFDAAANPGNSGGPLVTMDGHVVGIVTAIMNPNEQRTFIGIGFAVPIENAAGRRRPAALLTPFAHSPRHRMSQDMSSNHARIGHADGARALRSEARGGRAGPFPRARDGGAARAGPPAGRGRARAWPRRSPSRRCRPGHPWQLPPHPVHARPGAGRPGGHAFLQPEDRRVRHLARARCSPTCCWPTRSTARRPRYRARCWK